MSEKVSSASVALSRLQWAEQERREVMEEETDVDAVSCRQEELLCKDMAEKEDTLMQERVMEEQERKLKLLHTPDQWRTP